MARATNAGSATTSASNLLTGKCRRLWVRCDAGSAVSVRVRVQNTHSPEHIHGNDEYRTLAAGEEQVYDASADNPIASLEIYTGSGTGTYSFEVTGA